MSVGLVTTTTLVHATPAAFAVHVQDRDLFSEDIDAQLAGANIEVFRPIAKGACPSLEAAFPPTQVLIGGGRESLVTKAFLTNLLLT